MCLIKNHLFLPSSWLHLNLDLSSYRFVITFFFLNPFYRSFSNSFIMVSSRFSLCAFALNTPFIFFRMRVLCCHYYGQTLLRYDITSNWLQSYSSLFESDINFFIFFILFFSWLSISWCYLYISFTTPN